MAESFGMQKLNTEVRKNTKPLKQKLNSTKASDLIDQEYQVLFDSLDRERRGYITKFEILACLEDVGILSDDPRVQSLLEALKKPTGASATLSFESFKEIAKLNGSILANAIRGKLVIPNFKEFRAEISDIYEKVKENTEGKVATYIPQLGRVNPDQFAVSVSTIDGQRFSLGESNTLFCLQSVSKPITYCMALEEHGEQYVHKHVGREPSGRGFNELTLNNEGLPHNPMINSGAIMTCSLVNSKVSLADRFDSVLERWSQLSGGKQVAFNNAIYLSERETADRNFALGYFMREKKAFPAGADLISTLEFYFQCCSIEMTAEGLSIIASTLANGGVCPITGKRVFRTETVQSCLSLMGSCGMYDFSGEFAFTIGLPAKSGVSGALIVVIPQVMGICIWSPRLDHIGNSARGIEFCKELVAKYRFHTFDGLSSGHGSKKDPRLQKNQAQIEGVVALCWSASQGDLSEVKRLQACGVNLNDADYDGRTALHLAASEGHAHIVEYLLQSGAQKDLVDRWNGTPLSDAKRANALNCVELLERSEIFN